MDSLVRELLPEVLGIVPARGGSKSIPRKNIKPLASHPLLAYSIAAALAARYVGRIVVSTDDPEIAAIAREYGAEVPFLRPEELAQDHTPDFPVILHALNWLREHEAYVPDVVVQLRPTSPLRPIGLLDQAVETLLANPEANSVRGVSAAKQNPHKMWRIGKEGFLEPLLETSDLHEPYNMPRQLLPQVFWQTGHVDVIRRETILCRHSLTGDRVLPVIVDQSYCVDIDTDDDWSQADWLLSHHFDEIVRPNTRNKTSRAIRKRPLPPRIAMLVLDFDGVITDNRVWVTEQGGELVACNRSDGLGIEMLRERNIEVVIISKEAGPVVASRCRKLGIPLLQGITNKDQALRSWAAERNVALNQVVYVGNDVNDLPCLTLVGCGVAVADAHSEFLEQADLILRMPGGKGAVREMCDMILAGIKHGENVGESSC